MNNHLEALRQNVIADTVAAYPDFVFTLTTDPNGNLIIDYRGGWQQHRNPDYKEIPYMTITHDGERFFVSRYRWDENRPYKTLKGAAKYINAELQQSCDRVKKQKEKDDQEKAFAQKSVQMLRELHDTITRNGVIAKLCLEADRYQNNHVSVDFTRLNTEIDISVTSDYRLQIYFPYPRCYTDPDTAIDVLSALVKKGSALTAITATPATLAELIAAREAAEKDLRTMYRINRAFRAGHDAFVQQGFSADDYETFAATIRRYPEYGPVPFPLRIQSAKVAQIESLNKQITIGKRLLSPAKSG